MPTTTTAPPVRAELTKLNDDELLKSVVDHYHSRFKEAPQATKFLESCGIANSEAVEQFQIGFVDRTLKQLLPSHQVKAGSDLRKRLKTIGLLKSSGHEVFRGCIVVPVFNEQRNVVQIYGRRIDNVQKGTPNELWLCDHKAIELPEEIIALRQSRPKPKAETQAAKGKNHLVDSSTPAPNGSGRCRPPADSSSRSEKKVPLPSVADTKPKAPNGSGSAVQLPNAQTPTTPSPAGAPGTAAITFDDRCYRVRGLEKNMSSQQMKVNIMATRDDLVYMDTFDLCKARSRVSFIKATATELFVDEAVIKKDIGRLLLTLEQIQLDNIEATTNTQPKVVELTANEKRTALNFLRSKNLVDKILEDYDTCGLVGEESNKLVCYLAAISRRLKEPLAVLIQSGSAAGKTALMDATLAFVPDEHQIRYSAMTGQSLYYMGQSNLSHKILAIAEEEGVAQASYALKLLQSDGTLRIAAAGRNSGTGRQETETYEVEGPVMMFLTTTSETPDPELQNRCLTLHVNETPDQTAAIHKRQRDAYTLNGCTNSEAKTKIRQRHQNAQRLIETLPVVIPWADKLNFRSDQTRMRRDHQKYLSLIASITLLHQHQRPKKQRQVDGEAVDYLEATTEDAELANRLISEVMGQSLNSLLPQTRQLLILVDDHINQRCEQEKRPRSQIRFTQRQLREAFDWGDFQLRRHLSRLVELEYVLSYRTSAKNQRDYELLYDGQGRNGRPFVLGLTDPTKLTRSK